MRRLGRLLFIGVVTFGIIAVGVEGVTPVWLSVHTAKTAPDNTRLLPQDLQDLTVSQARGSKLSYFGYDFEVPWNDLDETRTKLYPNQVILTFRSGLRLMVGAAPARQSVNGFATSFKKSPQAIESAFGLEGSQADYTFIKKLYEFTPDKMNRWAISPSTHYREGFLLIIKSAALSPSANTGLFNIQTHNHRGFQQGNPQARPNILVELYSDEGSIHFTFSQKDYQNPAGVSQPEINRIVQSLHKVPPGPVNFPTTRQ